MSFPTIRLRRRDNGNNPNTGLPYGVMRQTNGVTVAAPFQGDLRFVYQAQKSMPGIIRNVLGLSADHLVGADSRLADDFDITSDGQGVIYHVSVAAAQAAGVNNVAELQNAAERPAATSHFLLEVRPKDRVVIMTHPNDEAVPAVTVHYTKVTEAERLQMYGFYYLLLTGRQPANMQDLVDTAFGVRAGV